jgi:hypothetical protein
MVENQIRHDADEEMFEEIEDQVVHESEPYLLELVPPPDHGRSCSAGSRGCS